MVTKKKRSTVKSKTAKPKSKRKPVKKKVASKAKAPRARAARDSPEVPSVGIPKRSQYTSITRTGFINQYLDGSVKRTTLNAWIDQGLIAIDESEKPARILIDHPTTKQFLENREGIGIEKTVLLTQKLNDLTLADIQDLSKVVIDRIKAIIDIQKVKIKNDAMTGVLISRKLVKRCFDQFIAIDNAILKTLGTALSSEIAAIFESTDTEKILGVQRLLDNEIRKAIETKRLKYINWLSKLDKND